MEAMTTDKQLSRINRRTNVLKVILLLIFLAYFYAAIEPFIYAYTGFGFVYDYNLDFKPLMKR